MKILFTLFLLCFSAIAADKPNVVILLADDLGWKDIGAYGGTVKTPNLDNLAANGSKFSNFYSGCAVCSPSRAVLLTGRHHIRAGVYSWIHDASQKSHLLESEVTIAEVLKEQGYSTAHIGKWHLGLPYNKHKNKPTPDKHGFDYWMATENNAIPSHKNPHNFVKNGKPVGKTEGYSCQLVVDEAINWLDNHRKKEAPFFLNIWFHEPHAPIAAPDEINNLYKGDKKAKVYSGTIDNTDRAIGRLLKKLEQVAPKEDTIIIYASDNGSYRADRVGDLRGKKGVNWEGGIRVPGIFYWPGKVHAGKTFDVPGGIVDVLPTLCDILGINTPKGKHIDGSSLKDVIIGDGSKFSRHQSLYWHLQKSRPIVAIRDGNYSLVAEPDYEISKSNMFKEEWIPVIKKGGYKNYQMFDLVKDPSQKKDISKENPELFETLKKKLLAINASVMAEGTDWHLK
ncbi:MAG: sulfatase-like hydrolase/transferase [Lentisphaeraceae bacterium]|nr:sulfatase-like hydrolase/transferase [Lentisphaeraceae bacterium]